MRTTKFISLLLVLVCLVSVAQAEAPKPLPFVPGSWTLVLLPDTQNYAKSHPATFKNQTKWIVDNAATHNIIFVMTEGDITNDNNAQQWTNAKNAMSTLDGKVPYAIVTGNHDYRGADLSKRATLANAYFPPTVVQKCPLYGGVFEKDKLDNAYYLFSAGGREWIAITLEYAPRNEAVAWAGKILDQYPKRSAIICTHAYLFSDNTRFDHKKKGQPKLSGRTKGLNDGEMLWKKLASKHKNVQFVVCGHVTRNKGVGRLTSSGDAGNTVHQILADFQSYPHGGDGYLRLMEFLPDGKTVQVKTYSTLLDKYITDDTQQFTLDLSPAP